MTKPFLPERLQQLAAGYVLGDLSREEAAEFQQLLANHPELSQEIDSLQEVLGLLPYALPEVNPPQYLRSVVLNAAETRTKSTFVTQKRLTTLLSSVAALLAIAIGLDNYRLRQELNTKQTQLVQQKQLINRLQKESDHPLVSQASASLSLNSEDFLEKNWNGLDKILKDHLRSISQKQEVVDLPSSSPTEIVQHFPTQFSALANIPVLANENSKLLGGSFCNFGKTQGIRFTYQSKQGQTISFYQLKRAKQPFFPQLGQKRLYVNQYSRPTILIWSDENFFYALVAQLPPKELEKLAAQIKYI